MEKLADVNAPLPSGVRPLEAALAGNAAAAANVLLNKGADPTVPWRESSRTPQSILDTPKTHRTLPQKTVQLCHSPENLLQS